MKKWQWKNFTPDELRCKCGCGQLVYEAKTMDRLQKVRDFIKKPMVITSGYRCPSYNIMVSSSGDKGPHTYGRAFDISVFGEDVLKLIEAASAYGFTGFGLKQHGAYNTRFLHIDDLRGDEHPPRPWVWSYAA